MWSVLAGETTELSGGGRAPSVRYSAAAVFHHRRLVVTHGYYYDHARRTPRWLNDAWAFSLDANTWTRIHPGGRSAPSARYSASATLHEGSLYLFGGDDGGQRTSPNSYRFDAHYDELWRLDLESHEWHGVANFTPRPPKRAQHSAVAVGTGAMYVYGGLGHADTWRYDFGSGRWYLLDAGPSSTSSPHPGVRHAHAAAPGSGGFYVFGGSRKGAAFRSGPYNDGLWFFHLKSKSWRKLERGPPARSHLTLVAMPRAHMTAGDTIVLYGGANCTIGCKCYSDTWTYTSSVGEGGRWSKVSTVGALPVHRYRHNMVVDPADSLLYLFGGESYQPYMYHNAVERLALPELRQFPTEGAAVPTTPVGGSRVLGRLSAGFAYSKPTGMMVASEWDDDVESID